MPKRKDDLLKKQKRLIGTRLMQISLLVDGYVYQQKPISVKSAFVYIKEISGYKDKCLKDVRSLQVIDKLTRCMKGIIDEQQEISECFEDVFVSSQHTPETTNSSSPVYSTIDDDLTQCLDIDEDITEIQENGNNNNYVEINSRNDVTKETDPFGATNIVETNNYVEINSSNDVTKETDPFGATNIVETKSKRVTESFNIIQAEKYPNTDLEVIDLCDYEKRVDSILTNQNTINEPDFDIQNAISNLSMKDIEKALPPFSQDCSQSILNSYSNLQTGVPLTLDHEDIITSTIHHKPATETKNDKITKIVLPKKIAKDQKVIAKEITAIQSNNITEEPEKTKAFKPVSKKRNAKNYDNSKADKTKMQNKPPETVKKQAQSKKTKCDKQLKPTVQTHAQKPSQNDHECKNKILKPTVQSYAQKPNQNQYECNNEIPLTTSKQLVNPTGTKTQISKDHPIYNRMVVNDLSWIENIRFVREIPMEEYESFTENEIFWENYTLPNNWNENDFNY